MKVSRRKERKGELNARCKVLVGASDHPKALAAALSALAAALEADFVPSLAMRPSVASERQRRPG